jgi:uncharacterized membrane protein
MASRGVGREDQMPLVIGTILKVGVVAAAAVALLGLTPYLIRFGAVPTDFGTFKGAAGLNTVDEIVKAAFRGNTAAIMQLGLVILILTPLIRVAFSAVAFALERDWLYVGLTVIVLGVLAFGLTGRVL